MLHAKVDRFKKLGVLMLGLLMDRLLSLCNHTYKDICVEVLKFVRLPTLIGKRIHKRIFDAFQLPF